MLLFSAFERSKTWSSECWLPADNGFARRQCEETLRNRQTESVKGALGTDCEHLEALDRVGVERIAGLETLPLPHMCDWYVLKGRVQK